MGLCLLPAPAIAVADQPCFTANDNARLSFEVLQQAPPPQPEATRYAYYPLTGAASMQLGSLARPVSKYATYYFQWANRSNAALRNQAGQTLPRKANLQPSSAGVRRQRTAFTGVAQADACTLAQTASVLGQPARSRGFAQAGHIRIVPETAQADVPPLGSPDTCVLPAGQLRSGKAGILLDFEVQDGRAGPDTMRFLQAYVRLVHSVGRQVILLIDPLDAPSQRYNGISAQNAHAIVALFDRTTIMLWSRNAQGNLPASYQKQKQIIAAGGPFDGGRLLVDFELAGTSLADATFVRQAIVADRLAGVLFWRNRARQGGGCETDVNDKIAAIAFGSNRQAGK